MIKKYEKHKESGIEWVGKIPAHWRISTVKRKLEFLNNKRVPIEAGLRFDRQGEFPYYGASGIIDYVDDYIFDGTHILIGEDGANILSRSSRLVFIAQGKFWVNNHAHILDVPVGNTSYFCEQLELNDFATLATGSAQPKLTKEALANLALIIPPIEEQTQIANFLDHQTPIIDNLISQKEKLINLLKEKRQAIINESVTIGLNPNAKMKDSGIEWLGKIPKNWNFRNLETVTLNSRYSFTGGPFGSDLKNEEYTEEGVRIIQLQNIGVGEFRDDYKIFTSEEKANQLSSCNIFPGDIIIAKMADPVARACIIPNADSRYIMASDGIRLEVDTDKFNVKFIEYAINAKYFNFQAELNSTGTTRLRIGLTTLKKLKLILPNIDEQNDIVRFLESYNNVFLETINKLSNQIDYLKDYRKSLISETVTGKIDVRDWKPANN